MNHVRLALNWTLVLVGVPIGIFVWGLLNLSRAVLRSILDCKDDYKEFYRDLIRGDVRNYSLRHLQTGEAWPWTRTRREP